MGSSIVTVDDGFYHPRPHNLDQIQVRIFRGPCRKAVQFTCLFGELSPLVLITLVVLCLIADQLNDFGFLSLGHDVSDNPRAVLSVVVSDRLVVVGARVVFDDELKSKLSEGRIQIFAVDVESFGCVLHGCRRLQVFTLCQYRATESVSFLNFVITRFELVARRGIILREVKLVTITDCTPFSLRARFCNEEDDAIIFKQGAETEVLRVTKANFHIGCTPRKSRRLDPPRNAPQKFNRFCTPPFLLLFVATCIYHTRS